MHLKLYNFRVPVYKRLPLPWMKWNSSFNDECCPAIVVWRVSNSEKCILNNATLGCPFIRGIPLPWMKWNPSFNDDCKPTIVVWRVSHFEMCILNYTTLGCPFIRGFPSHGWNETHPLTMSGYRSLKSFKFWKVHLKLCNFRVPVYKEVPLSWIKWNTSFNDEYKGVPMPWKKWHSSFADDCRSSILV